MGVGTQAEDGEAEGEETVGDEEEDGDGGRIQEDIKSDGAPQLNHLPLGPDLDLDLDIVGAFRLTYFAVCLMCHVLWNRFIEIKSVLFCRCFSFMIYFTAVTLSGFM